MLKEDLKYLKDALNIHAKAQVWKKKESLPLYLRSNAEMFSVTACGESFLLVRPSARATLPEIKRIYAQLQKYVDCPIAMSVPDADARQRKALVSQGIPFVCAGRQASLLFLGMASTEWGKGRLERESRKKLSPHAQQAAIWGALKGRSYLLTELRDSTGMSASQASEAVRELVQRGIASKTKHGREVKVMPVSVDELLTHYMECLSSPILRSYYIQRCDQAEKLPDAGETALAQRTNLIFPAIAQKAASRKEGRAFNTSALLEGELPEDEILQIQVWKYDPLTIDTTEIDNIALALSLVNNGDERIGIEIDSLFEKGYPWEKAQ